MKKLQISNANRAIIESIVRTSPKFKGNEELIDLFVDSIYNKTYLLMDTLRDEARLKKHLSAICDGCMEQIIKEKQKYTQTTSVYKQIERQMSLEDSIVKLKKTLLDDPNEVEARFSNSNSNKIVNLKEEIQKSQRYENVDSLIDPLEFCPQKRVSERTVEKLIQIVKTIDMKFPQKSYFEIFSLRYIKRFKQAEIARRMSISQIELSKRFVELIKLAKDNI